MSMVVWCIHSKERATGRVVKVQMPGPPTAEHMARIAQRALDENAPGEWDVDMVHEHDPNGSVLVVVPYFPTAIENMIFQGLMVVKALTFAAHYIINKQKEN